MISWKYRKGTKHLTFWLITAAAFVGLICPELLRDGMFMDGQQYACVAKNLASGHGSFWQPVLSDSWWKAGSNNFMEHPPLVYGMQSLFFKIMGEGMYTERIYSFLMAIISAFLIYQIWILIFSKNPTLRKYGWLPVLLWIITPVISWSFQNNMMENTMGVFILLSVFFALKSVYVEKKAFVWLFLAGISVFFASFSKGIPGFFTISFFVFYWATTRRISMLKTVLFSMIIILIPAVVYFFILQNGNAYEFFSFYLKERVLFRVNNEPVVNNHFSTLLTLGGELLPLIGFGLIVTFLIKILHLPMKFDRFHTRYFLLFIFLGLSGSIPLMLTPVQRIFYLMPALPFFGIAFSILLVPFVDLLVRHIKKITVMVRAASLLLLIAVTVYALMQIGTAGRDKAVLHDIYLIGNVVPENTTIKIEESIYDQWNLQFYLLRYFNINVTVKQESVDYYLLRKESDALVPDVYKKVLTGSLNYDLYKLTK